MSRCWELSVVANIGKQKRYFNRKGVAHQAEHSFFWLKQDANSFLSEGISIKIIKNMLFNNAYSSSFEVISALSNMGIPVYGLSVLIGELSLLMDSAHCMASLSLCFVC